MEVLAELSAEITGRSQRTQARDVGPNASRQEPAGSPAGSPLSSPRTYERTPLLMERGDLSARGESMSARSNLMSARSDRTGSPAPSAFADRVGGRGGSGGQRPNDGVTSGPMPESSIGGGPDIVQFSSMFFYVEEGTGSVSVTVMRIGSLRTPCCVEYRTEDNSAKAGLKYTQVSDGRIEFAPNEEMKKVDIQILEDDSFDTNLDFRVVLTKPQGCQLGENLEACRVMIIDDDLFPSNTYRDNILNEDLSPIGVRLLYAFIMFSIQRIPLVGWRTGWVLLCDQFSNVAYLIGIWLNIYTIDVVFSKDPATADQLWIPNQRLWTAVLVALGFILPKAILACIEWLKSGPLAVGGKVKLHLKVNLFRKYLYYSQISHAKVPAQELTKAMEDDINELVSYGFMVIFQIASQTVKVCVILFFLVHKRPSSALPLLIYPVAMFLVLNMRYQTTLNLKAKCRDAENVTMVCLRESCDDINLIKEYNMRTTVVGRYEQSIKDQRPPGDSYGDYDFCTMLVMPWITNLAIMLFMIVGGHFVLAEELSLGAYLATIGIYKDAGDLFSGFYGHLKECYGVIGPLLRIVRLLNLDTDVKPSMEQAFERSEGMLQELVAEEKTRTHLRSPLSTNRFDMLVIKLVHSSLANDRGGPTASKLQDISTEVPQGKMVAILGPHGSGKYSLLKLLTGLVKPKRGMVLVPTHLRCLCVTNKPQIFKNGDLLENLTFGNVGKCDKNRLMNLCKAVGLAEHTMRLLDKSMQEGPSDATKVAVDSGEARESPWYEQLSQSELIKMNIVRALNLNPEVLLLHRPVDEMEADHAANLLDVLRKSVDHRGLFLSTIKKAKTRPHTVFFTSGEDRERADTARDVADVVWHVSSEKGFWSEQGGVTQAGNSMNQQRDGQNKIVSSWSREVRSLQVNLDKERHLHTATLEELDSYRGKLENLRDESEHYRGALNDVTSQAKKALRDAKSYESELAVWEGEQKKAGWLACVSPRAPPAPKNQSNAFTNIITSGEGRKEASIRSQSRGFSPR